MTKTFELKCRNNADARRMGSRQIRVPGAQSVTHTGGKNVRVISCAPDTTKAWLDKAFEVDSYTES